MHKAMKDWSRELCPDHTDAELNEDAERLITFFSFIENVRARRASLPPEQQKIPKPYPTKYKPFCIETSTDSNSYKMQKTYKNDE
jgi:hypothetical protein